jgi:hypothetical protein
MTAWKPDRGDFTVVGKLNDFVLGQAKVFS